MKHRSRLRFILEGIEGFVVLGVVLGTWPISKRVLRNWGSQLKERERAWPGDRYVAQNHEAYTRAVSIGAPADAVWRWVVQFGLGRAGFYSYELLERIVGIPVTNVESIESTLQHLAVGDEILLHPKAPGIPIAHLEVGRQLCFGAKDDADPPASKQDPRRSWSIYIEPTGEASCRLLLRGCIEPTRGRSWLKRFGAAVEQPIDFVMEQRMLRTVRRLAELQSG